MVRKYVATKRTPIGRASTPCAPFRVLMLIQIKTAATNSKYPHQFSQTGFIGETCASSRWCSPNLSNDRWTEGSRPRERAARLRMRWQLSLRTRSIPRDDHAQKPRGDSSEGPWPSALERAQAARKPKPDRHSPGESAREPHAPAILAACRVCELHSAQIAIVTSRISND